METKMFGKKDFNAVTATLALGMCIVLIAGLFSPAALAQSKIAPDKAEPTDDQPKDTGVKRWSEEDIQTYVTVMDRKIVADIFGSRISKRFIAFQVTVENRNENLQFLIHDLSLDLERVFNPPSQNKVAAFTSQTDGTSSRDTMRTAPLSQPAPGLKTAGRSSMYRYRLSSIEHSLLRGVAEKGQGQDKRNLILRMLRGTGSLAAALMGVTTLGASYAPAVAAFNGPGLTTYSDMFPDYTINQLNRLNDSAYRSNTLVSKQQGKVIVAFVPQAIFLTKVQRELFNKDPLLLTTSVNGGIDFRRAEVIVNGSFIVEVNKQPPSLTSGMIETTDPQIFQSDKPVLKGHLFGNFLANTDIKFAEPAPTGFSVEKDGSPTDTELKFTIKANGPVPPSKTFNLEVSNAAGKQTFAVTAQYLAERPTIANINPPEIPQPSEQTIDKEFTVTGTNFFPDMTSSNVTIEPFGSGVQVVKVTYISPTEIKATLKIDKGAASGERKVWVNNPAGRSLGAGKLNIKAPEGNDQ